MARRELVLKTDNTNHTSRKLRKRLYSSRQVPEFVSLLGEIQSLSIAETHQLTPNQRIELLSYENCQEFCLRFFEMVNVEVKPQIRIEGKRRFVRLSLNNGEHVVEEEMVTYYLSRLAVCIKAVRLFNPGVACEWLQKYKKQRSALNCHFG